MSTEIRRVSIRAGSRQVDASLPAHIPIGEILPATVDLVTKDDDELRGSFLGQNVGICRVGVPPLNPSGSLAQAGVADGELLMMTAEHVTPPVYRFDACSVIREVTEAASPSPHSLRTPKVMAALLCCAGVVELCLLVGSLTSGRQSQALIGGLVSTISASLAAVAFRRSAATNALSAVTGVWAAMFAAASGALVVPGHPAASHLLLALSGCSTVAFLLARLLGCGTSVLTPIAGATGAASLVTLGAALNWWPSAAVGPSLVVVSLTSLAMGPRVATVVARLTDEEVTDEDLNRRAVSAHGLLSNFVSTSAGGTALGCVLTATCGTGGIASGCLIAAGAVVLLSHLRRHRDPFRAASLALSGAVAITAFLLAGDVSECFWAPWLFSALIPSALACAWFTARAGRPSIPFGRRIIEGIEFAMSAAVPALACWAMGLFSAVRGLSLP